MKSSVFWDITSYSPLNVNRRFRGTMSLPSRSKRNSSMKQTTYFSTLKMEVIYLSETSVYYQQTRRYYIPESRTLKGIHYSVLSIHFILRKSRTKNGILDSSVGIVTLLWYEQPTIPDSIPCRSKVHFVSLHGIPMALGRT
jgi:hypothetical protein